MKMITANARIEMRVSSEFKKLAERASILSGERSTTDYITRLVEQDAKKVILQHQSMTVENDMFDQFISACDQATAPNKALERAANKAKMLGF